MKLLLIQECGAWSSRHSFFLQNSYPFDSLVQYFLNIILSEFRRTNDCARVFLAFWCISYFCLFENRWSMPSYIFLWLLHIYKVLCDSYPNDISPRTDPRLTFPRCTRPLRTYPLQTIPRQGISPTGHFPDHQLKTLSLNTITIVYI